MLATFVAVIAVVLLTASSLLAGLLAVLQWDVLASLRRGERPPGGEVAGYALGQGYIVCGAMGGGLCAALALLIHRPTWAWGAAVLAVHLLVILGVWRAQALYERPWRQRALAESRLAVCPRCGAKVRPDRLSRHVHRVHDQSPPGSRTR